MAIILPDREIRRLLEKVIIGSSPASIGPNSYELRLGQRVKFDSTGEELEIPQGHFLEIQPGDFVTIASWERLDFRRETLQSIGKKSIAGLITPTTTMMREGFLFTTTKVDPGFRGVLNWGIRNSSVKTVRLRQGERLFKLTFFELEDDEIPETLYGEGDKDSYQDSDGIVPSARMIPADIPDRQVVRRTERKLDPTKQLLEAGYPFSHIGTELINLHGKFEIVSKDVLLLKEEFGRVETSLEGKIEKETTTLSAKIGDMSDSVGKKMKEVFSDQFEAFFDRKMLRVYGTLVTIISFGVAVYNFVLKSAPPARQAWIFMSIGALALVFTLVMTRKQ
jgi:deoxycytidine triphosphate deaminase